QVGQVAGAGVAQQPAGVDEPLRGEAQQFAGGEVVGDVWAAPVPAVREGPVEGEDESGGTRGAGMLDTAEHVVAGADPVDLEQGLRGGRHHLTEGRGGKGTETDGGTAGGGSGGHCRPPAGW